MKIDAFFGEGPGAQAQDGCSVEVYRSSPYAGDIEHLSEYLEPGTSVLELGCGTGRVTRRLLSMGCVVTAVDNSDEMLAYAPTEAKLVLADIEQLDLGEKFDVVMLGSGLINHPKPEVRSAFLGAAAKHLGANGIFILQRQDPAWLSTAAVGPAGEANGLAVRVETVSRTNGLVAMTLRYDRGGESWLHSFTLAEVDETMLELQIGSAGFDSVEWLDTRRCWIKAGFPRAG
ncbi:class I SAM-dependent methyltransferase [Paucibacter sp. DJ1R-11]|uniref:class I SAM-dependent methyltransferase n=1 Tax=Paucibacter sp. DJ1R-11 TaxID=2893556 RepID=UPI0021E41DA9|nr:class I SAM-dependent methyltransferase [Paucibacter sp. DJ1R-11]MCV2366413.1 class I SAM-dependent methyltransferase [Paucibacter sp. DJ1R-11]